ncbi:MAG: flagellar basal body P-ring protein FlgI, partial [Candidatus Kapaibacteriota bacterium]
QNPRTRFDYKVFKNSILMDMKRVATICLLIFFAFLLTSARIKDIAKIEGQTVVQAIGYGLVSGLNNTGDNQLSTHTVQSVINMLKRFGLTVPQTNPRIRNGELRIELDREYIRSKGGAEGVSKMVTIAEGSERETRVKGFMCPIKITADVEMQKVAYECGIGKKNGLGFGMLEVVNRTLK